MRLLPLTSSISQSSSSSSSNGNGGSCDGVDLLLVESYFVGVSFSPFVGLSVVSRPSSVSFRILSSVVFVCVCASGAC